MRSFTVDRIQIFELQPPKIEVDDQVIEKGFLFKTFIIFGGQEYAATTTIRKPAVNLRRLKITKTF